MKYLICYKTKLAIKPLKPQKYKGFWDWLFSRNSAPDEFLRAIVIDALEKTIQEAINRHHEDMKVLGIKNFTMHETLVDPINDDNNDGFEELERIEVLVEFHDPMDEEKYIHYMGSRNVKKMP